VKVWSKLEARSSEIEFINYDLLAVRKRRRDNRRQYFPFLIHFSALPLPSGHIDACVAITGPQTSRVRFELYLLVYYVVRENSPFLRGSSVD